MDEMSMWHEWMTHIESFTRAKKLYDSYSSSHSLTNEVYCGAASVCTHSRFESGHFCV